MRLRLGNGWVKRSRQLLLITGLIMVNSAMGHQGADSPSSAAVPTGGSEVVIPELCLKPHLASPACIGLGIWL